MLHYLFSFKGRINRAKLWLFVLINFVALIVLCAVILGGMSASGVNFADPKATTGAVNVPVLVGTFIVIFVFYIALLWAGIAVTVKRLHDRNKSGLWLLAMVLVVGGLEVAAIMMMGGPIAMHPMNQGAVAPSPLAAVFLGLAGLVSLWWFVELYCLRGTRGENRFGPDPLAN